MRLYPNDKILFEGDSVTDSGRDRADLYGLKGYTSCVSGHLRLLDCAAKCFNRGVSGDRSSDLLLRIENDLQQVQPTIVSILIGINDTWRRYDGGVPTSAEQYAENVEKILGCVQKFTRRIILMEPFLLPSDPDKEKFREDLDPKILKLRKIALKYDAELIPLDGLMWESAVKFGAEKLSADGVHPSPEGCMQIASHWLKRVQL